MSIPKRDPAWTPKIMKCGWLCWVASWVLLWIWFSSLYGTQPGLETMCQSFLLAANSTSEQTWFLCIACTQHLQMNSFDFNFEASCVPWGHQNDHLWDSSCQKQFGKLRLSTPTLSPNLTPQPFNLNAFSDYLLGVSLDLLFHDLNAHLLRPPTLLKYRT